MALQREVLVNRIEISNKYGKFFFFPNENVNVSRQQIISVPNGKFCRTIGTFSNNEKEILRFTYKGKNLKKKKSKIAAI